MVRTLPRSGLLISFLLIVAVVPTLQAKDHYTSKTGKPLNSKLYADSPRDRYKSKLDALEAATEARRELCRRVTSMGREYCLRDLELTTNQARARLEEEFAKAQAEAATK